jgi:hypothetical protein
MEAKTRMRRGYAPMACFLALLTACTEPSLWSPERPEKTIVVDMPLNDQCFFYVTERPDDCDLGLCMYADAVLDFSPTESGLFSLTTRAYGDIWLGGRPPRDEPPMSAITAPSPAAAAARLPEALAALDLHSRPIGDICVGVVADQDLHFGDVVAFRNALTALGLRKVAFRPEIARE